MYILVEVSSSNFALLHLFFCKKTFIFLRKALIFSTYFLQLIVLILRKIILSGRNNFN